MSVRRKIAELGAMVDGIGGKWYLMAALAALFLLDYVFLGLITVVLLRILAWLHGI